MVQGALPDPWCDKGIEQTYLVDAIVRLLQQAPPDQTTRLKKIGYVYNQPFFMMMYFMVAQCSRLGYSEIPH